LQFSLCQRKIIVTLKKPLIDNAIPDSIYFSSFSFIYVMPRNNKNKTHAYSAKRSGSKKYAKAERRKRNKPRV
jgi:hypothetical protein